MAPPKLLPIGFYERDPELVARDLLGKRLLRKTDGGSLVGIIVEAEAYYGRDDPASRAYRGMKPYNRLMWSEPGKAFIYNVHNNWLFNVIAHEPGKVGGVLIRAIEPTEGVETMKLNRGVGNLLRLTSGPGRLTKALAIDKSLNGAPVTSRDSEIQILDCFTDFEIESSGRIGVRRDLDKPLRFYIKGIGSSQSDKHDLMELRRYTSPDRKIEQPYEEDPLRTTSEKEQPLKRKKKGLCIKIHPKNSQTEGLLPQAKTKR